MTLSRQLLQLIVLILSLMLIASWLIFVQSFRSELQQQLTNQAQDTAAALSLAIAPVANPANKDAINSTLQTFNKDRNILSIHVIDSKNESIVAIENAASSQNEVPNWFQQIYSLQIPKTSIPLRQDDQILGTISVTIDASAAYYRLWRTGWNYTFASLLILIFAIAAALILVRKLLSPLKELQQHAEQISERNFKPIDAHSSTTEVVSLIQSFNQMAETLNDQFKTLEERAQRLQIQAFQDDETGFGNRRGFLDELSNLTHGEQATIGCIALIKLNLAELIAQQNYEGVIRLWSDFKLKFKSLLKTLTPVYRIHDDEIALLLPQYDRHRAEQLAEQLALYLSERDPKSIEGGLGSIGICYFRPQDTKAQLLSELDLAQQQAKELGKNSFYFNASNRDLPEVLLSKRGRQQLIERIIQEQRFEFRCQPVKHLDKETCFYTEWLPTFSDSKGNLLPPATILALARQNEKLEELEQVIVHQAINFARQQSCGKFALNLDPGSLKQKVFSQWLITLCKDQPAIAERMVIEIDERQLADCYRVLLPTTHALQQLGVQLAIDHFGAANASVSMLTSIKPNFLKLDGRFNKNLPEHQDNQFFIQTLQQLCRGLKIKLIALEIEQAEDLQLLRQFNVDGGQGFLLGKPAPLANASKTS